MLALAAPAILAGAAYLDAKWQLSRDINVIIPFIASSISLASKTKRGRLNVFYDLENRALSSAYSGRPFLSYEGKEWTYYQVYNEVLLHGTWLKQSHGIAQGEVVALNFMNCPEFIFLWFGLWSIGAVPAFINYNLKGKSLVHAVATSKARVCLFEPEVAELLDDETLVALRSGQTSDGPQARAILVYDDHVRSNIANTPAVRASDAVRDRLTPESMALLIFTSGTTGFPKAAILSWARYVRSMELMAAVVGMKATDRYYGCMPLYHTTAAMLGLGCALAAGGCFVIGRQFSVSSFWKDVRESRATAFQYVGETCRYLLTAPPQVDPHTGENLDKQHNVRLIFGNGLRPDVWQKFKDRFGIETIAEFYGATEGPFGAWNISRNNYSRDAIGKNGKVLTASIKRNTALVQFDRFTGETFRDPSRDNFCKRVANGEAGELLVRLDRNNPQSQFRGYYGNSAASDSKIMRDVFEKGDVWYKFGDVLRWDHEDRLFFVDRLGDTFRWKSENVSTSEVSAAFGDIPNIVEVNAYGVQLPNHDGRAGCAAMQLKPDLSKSEFGDTLRLAAECLPERLQKHAVPVFLRIVPAFERTGTNKQTKTGLQAASVDPKNLASEETLWWLREGRYISFTQNDWEALQQGRTKL